ncbi:DNA polymerase III subunit delta' [Sandaracinobacter sp. RS1-74]|uniref:DNA polymerase III subunit delta' n=1 Tax=Sandaracinobacteroides sayramensis TaxID=2913411 RepID=UPI001EDC0683|nr:DNA polymerase III subunit delta' [Sandaracinobacteroides sayramensis]MCG2840060.1 DNA polymerase III subunit delta' [Sandaracinobacteroides sayramensis]
MLIGHRQPREAFLDALQRGRMHHAWLIAGPKGVGKRAFADWAALKLLSGSPGPGDTPADDPAASLVAAGSHPDHRLLAPPEEGKGSATASIVVDQVRELSDFLHSYPAIARWRTLIVDSIDDMNINTSNAFLKELEEPRQQTIYLLVSHAPARLLPTIRSRCRMIRLFPLPEADVRQVLEQTNPDMPAADLEPLVTLARGAPGAVSDLAGADLAGLEKTLDRIAAGGDAVPLARSLQPQAAIPKLRALLALVPRRLAAAARRNPDPRLLQLYEEAEALARDAVRLAYDRPQVAMALADITARAGRIQDNR